MNVPCIKVCKCPHTVLLTGDLSASLQELCASGGPAAQKPQAPLLPSLSQLRLLANVRCLSLGTLSRQDTSPQQIAKRSMKHSLCLLKRWNKQMQRQNTENDPWQTNK